MESKFLDFAVLLAAFWALLKWTVSRELKNIYATINREFQIVNGTLQRVEKQGDGHSRELRNLHARVSVLESTSPGVGRRKTDHCSSPECPYEDPAIGMD